jgi:hypothetical protein
MWGSLKMCTSSVEVVGYKEKWRHCSGDQLTPMHSLLPAAQSRQLCIRAALDPCSHSFIFARADLILILTNFYYVRFQVLTVASMKMRATFDIAPCSFGVDWRFRGVYCLHHQGGDDGGSMYLWNIRLLHQDYMAVIPEGSHVWIVLIMWLSIIIGNN